MNKARWIEQAASELTKDLTDKGKLIEASFALRTLHHPEGRAAGPTS
jgi:hypothetical protein